MNYRVSGEKDSCTVEFYVGAIDIGDAITRGLRVFTEILSVKKEDLKNLKVKAADEIPERLEGDPVQTANGAPTADVPGQLTLEDARTQREKAGDAVGAGS